MTKATEHSVLPPYVDGPGRGTLALVVSIGSVVVGAAAFGPIGGLGGAVVAGAAYAGLWGVVRVGDDGIGLSQWHAREFLAYERVTWIGVTERGARVEADGGAVYYLPTGLADVAEGGAAHDRRERLAAAIRGRYEAFRGLPPFDPHAVPPGLTLRAEGEREDAWVERMRALGAVLQEPAAYRAGAAPREQLLAVVENRRAHEELRFAATVALAALPDADPSIAARLVEVGATTASPRLRASVRRVTGEGRARGRA